MRPQWIQSARYTFLQTSPWTPIQECLNEACEAYDELLGQYKTLCDAILEDEAAGTFPHRTSQALARPGPKQE